MNHYANYRIDENPFIRMHTLDLRHEQIYFRYDLMGPERLRIELTRSRNRMAECIREGRSLEDELEFQEMINELLKEFENVPQLAYDRAYENCLEYVAREVLAHIMETINHRSGDDKCPGNAASIISQTEYELFECDTEAVVGDFLNHVVEENDVSVPHAYGAGDVLRRARQIFQKELTSSI